MKSNTQVMPGSRDLRFDTLRGLLLVCMTINHLPTELRAVTDQSLGLFSAAEGFVFISGLMAGWVYTRKLRTLGHDGLTASALRRTRSIYLWHVASFAAAFLCIRLTVAIAGFVSTTSPLLFFSHPLASLALGAALLYQPGLLDLLPMYCAFVLLLPAVIGSLEAGHRWTVLGISGAVWLATQWAPPMAGAPLGLLNTGTFNLFAWQFIFVLGIAIGHARMSGQPQVVHPNRWALAGALGVATYCFGLRHFDWTPVWRDETYGILLNKPDLGLLRLADFGSVAYLIGIIGSRFPSALTWRPLALLGRHSLVVVAAQSVAVLVLLQFDPLFATATGRTLTAAAAVGILFAAAWAQEVYFRRTKPRADALPLDPRQGPIRPAFRTDDARAA